MQFEGRWARGGRGSNLPEGRLSVPLQGNIIQTLGTFALKLQSRFDEEPGRKEEEKEDSFLKNLQIYLINSAEEKHFYDFKLVCRDGTEIKCHKIILVSQSKYFQSLLSQEETDSARLDFSGETCRACRDFLYSGSSVMISEETVQDLLLASNYLIMDSLQALCQSYILDRLDVTNCLEIFKLADQTGSQALASRASSVIAFNFGKLFRSEESLRSLPQHLFWRIVSSELLVIQNDFGIILPEPDSRKEISDICNKYLELNGQDESLKKETRIYFRNSFISSQFTSGDNSRPPHFNFNSRGFGKKFIRRVGIFHSRRPEDDSSVIGEAPLAVVLVDGNIQAGLRSVGLTGAGTVEGEERTSVCWMFLTVITSALYLVRSLSHQSTVSLSSLPRVSSSDL